MNIDFEDRRLIPAVVAVVLSVVVMAVFPVYALAGVAGFLVGCVARPKLDPLLKLLHPPSKKEKEIVDLKAKNEELVKQIEALKGVLTDGKKD